MNKFLFALTLMFSFLYVLVLFIVEDNKKNQYVCIEDYMYMRVENNLLIYPNSVEPMRCSVFEYNLKNKKEVN